MEIQLEPQGTDGAVLKLPPPNPKSQILDFPDMGIADLDCDYTVSSPFHVNYCGYEPCEPGHTFGPYARTSYLLHFVYSGKGYYKVGDNTYSIHAGQIFLIYPNIVTTYWADEEDPWAYSWVGFSGYRSEYVASQMGFSSDHLVITLDDLAPIRQSIERMMQLHKLTYSNDLGRTAELLHIFSYVLDHNLQPIESAYVYPKSTYAQAAMQYIIHNYHKRIRISEIANHIGVDRSYLSKSFREEYQMSPQEYLLRLRMEQAQQLLLKTDAPIASIASDVGYADQLAFSKMFKQHTGWNPTEYRNQNHA